MREVIWSCQQLTTIINNYPKFLFLSMIKDINQQLSWAEKWGCQLCTSTFVIQRQRYDAKIKKSKDFGVCICKCHFFLYLRHAPSHRVGSLRNYTTAMPGISKSSRRKMTLRVSFFSMRGHIRASPCGTLILKNANNCNFSSRKLVNVHFFS